ncbi:hypothetical protein BGZ47_000700 [Haplosporangium gracile]|nr:hypothetical protein BGZ47_000700 [Haplosporangium gracile]
MNDEKAKEKVDKEVERMRMKRKRTEAFDDVFTAQKAAAFDALRGRPSVPQELVDRATDIVKTSHPNTDTFFKHNLTTQLHTPYRQEQYRESLRLNFDEAWTAATNLHNPNATAQAGSGTSTLVSQGDMTAGESGDYLPDEDEDGIADLMEGEAKERETKRLRTVTVPLKGPYTANFCCQNADPIHSCSRMYPAATRGVHQRLYQMTRKPLEL